MINNYDEITKDTIVVWKCNLYYYDSNVLNKKKDILYILKKYSEDCFSISNLIYKEIDKRTKNPFWAWGEKYFYITCHLGAKYVEIVGEDWIKWKKYDKIIEI